MRPSSRIALAILTFAAVALLPHVITGGAAGPTSDLGLGRLLAHGSSLALAVAFVGGVLTSLTPCVYPLIPITVSVFGAKRSASRAQAMALSGLYVLGLATTYSALGVAAALTGKAFGSVLQSPWAVAGVAALFTGMALSMFGVFELRLPASLQRRLSRFGGAGPAGSYSMGLAAGLVAAPCTGPVLASALTYVASRGSVAFGLAIMFAYALGIGLLFFLIGAFAVSLPKSGPWMVAIKSVFGVALLATGAVFLQSAFPATKSLFSTSRHALVAAAAAAAVGVLIGSIQASFSGPSLEKLGKALGLVLTVGGITYAIGTAGAVGRASIDEIPWLHDEPRALALAEAEGRPVVIDFGADWCAACHELDHTAWADPRVREQVKGFVAVKVDGSTEDAAFLAAVEKYRVMGLPTVIFIDAHGRELPERIMGAVSADEMLEALRQTNRACDAPLLACTTRW